MGHFGARPIRVAWLGLVFPALVLCYLGQGALVLRDAQAVENPFFAMVPRGWPTYCLVALATAATIIASQALISGVFSLTHQAVQLGLFPRVTVTHTSRKAEGQIYVPEMNWALCILCIALVLAFRESARLAAAYGIAVSGTMGITSVVFFVVTRRTWKWPSWKALPPLVLFLSLDLPFFAANLTKVVEGGWIPIVVGAVMMIVMLDWKLGRSALAARITEMAPPLPDFIATIDQRCPTRVPGTAIILASNLDATPSVLVTHTRRLRALREHVVLASVTVEHVPYVTDGERVSSQDLGHGFMRVDMRAGYMEKPDVPGLLALANVPGLDDATYFIGRESFLVGKGGKLGVVAEGLFAFLSRNAKSATSWFGIPPDQVVELGMQIDL
jgi:KUP system potassium uptake protein